jgi:hypothetical protein
MVGGVQRLFDLALIFIGCVLDLFEQGPPGSPTQESSVSVKVVGMQLYCNHLLHCEVHISFCHGQSACIIEFYAMSCSHDAFCHSQLFGLSKEPVVPTPCYTALFILFIYAPCCLQEPTFPYHWLRKFVNEQYTSELNVCTVSSLKDLICLSVQSSLSSV